MKKMQGMTLRKLMATLVLMMFVGINTAYAGDSQLVSNNGLHITKQDMLRDKMTWFFPIKIVGVMEFDAILLVDFSQADTYTPPTIRLGIPTSDNDFRVEEVTKFNYTISDINIMAFKLGIKLDYCSHAVFTKVQGKTTLIINQDEVLCHARDLDLESIFNSLMINAID